MSTESFNGRRKGVTSPATGSQEKSSVSDKAKETLKNLWSEDPWSFNIPVMHLIALFLTYV